MAETPAVPQPEGNISKAGRIVLLVLGVGILVFTFMRVVKLSETQTQTVTKSTQPGRAVEETTATKRSANQTVTKKTTNSPSGNEETKTTSPTPVRSSETFYLALFAGGLAAILLGAFRLQSIKAAGVEASFQPLAPAIQAKVAASIAQQNWPDPGKAEVAYLAATARVAGTSPGDDTIEYVTKDVMDKIQRQS
jgi:hypothetical protein